MRFILYIFLAKFVFASSTSGGTIGGAIGGLFGSLGTFGTLVLLFIIFSAICVLCCIGNCICYCFFPGVMCGYRRQTFEKRYERGIDFWESEIERVEIRNKRKRKRRKKKKKKEEKPSSNTTLLNPSSQSPVTTKEVFVPQVGQSSINSDFSHQQDQIDDFQKPIMSVDAPPMNSQVDGYDPYANYDYNQQHQPSMNPNFNPPDDNNDTYGTFGGGIINPIEPSLSSQNNDALEEGGEMIFSSSSSEEEERKYHSVIITPTKDRNNRGFFSFFTPNTVKLDDSDCMKMAGALYLGEACDTCSGNSCQCCLLSKPLLRPCESCRQCYIMGWENLWCMCIVVNLSVIVGAIALLIGAGST